MELKELEELSDKLENEAYTLSKAIEVLLYELLPDDNNEKIEQATVITNLILQQAKRVHKVAEDLSTMFFNVKKERGNIIN
ncbi:hypothetical protein [Anaerococcus tetradius]|uniref:Uncharacterized protein n=1 Tax=Anaerococcus tetradius TaxID=33036 RepID=A0A133KEG2_9FIRM|nr:hypothetical protein [Anaerococcus tetradius]KWZ77958.1 hypothetical protein HMPREF3200_01007 [Anaerococcus tetradius]